MSESTTLPSLAAVVASLESDDRVRHHVQQHHLNFWRKTRGSFEVLRDVKFEFDPRADYWYRTERRVVVAYLARYFAECFDPPTAMRKLAFDLVQSFERARLRGAFGEPALAGRHAWPWPRLRDALIAVAREIPASAEFEVLKRHLKASSVAESLVEFLSAIEGVPALDRIERNLGLTRRIAWFPFLGLDDLTQLRDRQRWFSAFYALFTSTNAYKVGGAQTFASVLQNNPSRQLLGFVDCWVSGQTLDQTGFVVNMRDVEQKDIRHYSTVMELYGFLTLQKQPFYNSAVSAYDTERRPEDGDSILPALARIGARTRRALSEQPGLVDRLAGLLIDGLEKLPSPELVAMEGSSTEDLADPIIADEIDEKALAFANKLDRLDAAAVVAHLALDAYVYLHQSEESEVVHLITRVSPPSIVADSPKIGSNAVLLPVSLHRQANEVLSMLRAGFHVLLAGAPGTGKTTLAQFVGHAWNHGRSEVVSTIEASAAPKTTVANSAWAPFHTIGGIVPDGKGQFRVQRGIFIDPDSGHDEGVWQLLPQSLVLDEMNRADLDRCIGELYPLLTHSVLMVVPAGIPGVREIRDHPRFRIVATVNDASIPCTRQVS
jgi:hypothetical protein